MNRRRRREEDPELDAHNYAPAPASKRRRRRRQPPPAAPGAATLGAAGEPDTAYATTGNGGGGSATVLVNGLPSGCTVLELKSRMQMYGAISRIRIDGDEGVGYVTYRSPDSARAAISASVDPAFGITIGTRRVHLCQVSEPAPQWHTGLISTQSKLLRAELPLRKHGRGNKKLNEGMGTCNRSIPDMPYEGRQIIAYDDLL